MAFQVKDANGNTITIQSSTNGSGEHAPSQGVTPDVTVTGPAAQSVLNTDLLTGTVSGWYDASAYQSGAIQIIASAGASGQIIFEQTNDTTLAAAGVPLRATEVSGITANPNVSAIAIAASTQRLFKVVIAARFIRVRISTAFTGGTVQAVAVLSQRPTTFMTMNVQQAVAANLQATAAVASIAAGTTLIGDVNANYRQTVTGAGTPLSVLSPATPAATVIKAAAGKIIGGNLQNSSAALRSVKFFNVAAASVVLGTTVAAFEVDIPAGANVQIGPFEGGIGFVTAISYAITSAKGLTDNTATGLAANDVSGMILFA